MALVITLADVGGAQTYLESLIPALSERYDLIVAAGGEGPIRELTGRCGARFVPLRHMVRPIKPLEDLRGLLELVGLFREFRPQIVHVNTSKAGFLGRIAAALTRVPIRIFTVHGWAFAAYEGWRSPLYRWMDRLVRPLTTLVICVSERDRRIGIEAGTCADGRTAVIPNGAPVHDIPLAAPTHNPPTIVSVGRLAYPKDFVTLLQALGALETKAYTALLVGEGPDRESLEPIVDGLGLGDQVVFAGTRPDVQQILGSADVLVLSSRSEGMPLAVLEAMAAGLPVIATNVGGIPEVVVDGETGFLVPSEDVTALRDAIEALLADPRLRQSLGQAGRARAIEHFSLERVRTAHISVYDALLREADRR